MYNNRYDNNGNYNDDHFIAGVYGASIIQDNLMYNQIVAAFISQGMNSYEAGLAADRHFGIDRNATSYRVKAAISTGVTRILCFIFIAPVVFILIAVVHEMVVPHDHSAGSEYCTPVVPEKGCPNYIAPADGYQP